jgi:hypothetical protein
MLRNFLGLFAAARKTSGTRPVRKPTFRPTFDELETRLVPSTVPLHAAGTQLVDPNGNAVVLRGVNIGGLESYPTGFGDDQGNPTLLNSVNVALNDWHANLIRLTVYPDFWFGNDQGVGLPDNFDPNGAAYQDLVKQVIDTAQADNAYVMLAVWGSDMGNPAAAPAMHDLPDSSTAAFWQSAATTYANNPAVLFDPFNEPHGDHTWDEWLNGGGGATGRPQITDESGTTYDSPGMQGLLNVIRGTGADNIVAPEGLGYGSDLSGLSQGYAPIDPANNLMYQFHLYPAEDSIPDGVPSVANRDALVQAAAGHPIYIGEWGTYADGDTNPDAQNTGAGWPTADQWSQNMLAWLAQHQYNWTAWELGASAGPNLISDWNDTPTSYFGQHVKDALATGAPTQPVPTETWVFTSSANPNAGDTVTFTAAVTTGRANLDAPEGLVDFYDGGTLLGQVTLQGGQATFSTSTLDVGEHFLTASYEGSDSDGASQSAPLAVTVNDVQPDVVAPPNALALTVPVAGSPPAATVPPADVPSPDAVLAAGDPAGILAVLPHARGRHHAGSIRGHHPQSHRHGGEKGGR